MDKKIVKTVKIEIEIPEQEYDNLLAIAERKGKDPVMLVRRAARMWIRSCYRILTLPPNYSDLEI